MTKDVFISYSRENRNIANQIARDLEGSGLHVFYDEELLPGEEWGPRIEQQLRGAKHVLVLLSPSYLRSSWARKELELAVLSESQGETRIVPVLIEDTDIPSFLRGKHYADLRADYATGLALIKKALATQPEVREISRARRYATVVDTLGLLGSLLGAALASAQLTSVAPRNFRVAVAVAVVVAFAVTGLTGLLKWLSAYRSSRRSKPLQLVSQGVERAYIEALDHSDLNPVGIREGSRA